MKMKVPESGQEDLKSNMHETLETFNVKLDHHINKDF